MAIESAVLPNSQLDLLTVPSERSYAITTVLVCNYDDTASAAFDMHIIKSGQARGNDNMVVNRLELPAGETFTFDTEKIVLEEGDYISFFATPDADSGNTNLTALISYLEV